MLTRHAANAALLRVFYAMPHAAAIFAPCYAATLPLRDIAAADAAIDMMPFSRFSPRLLRDMLPAFCRHAATMPPIAATAAAYVTLSTICC